MEKLVSESLSQFQRGVDPKSAMGVGSLEELLQKYGRRRYSNYDDYKSSNGQEELNHLFHNLFEYCQSGEELLEDLEIFFSVAKKVQLRDAKYGFQYLSDAYDHLNDIGATGPILEDIWDLLIEKGAKMDYNGWQPFREACQGGQLELVKMFLRYDANPYMKDNLIIRNMAEEMESGMDNWKRTLIYILQNT